MSAAAHDPAPQLRIVGVFLVATAVALVFAYAVLVPTGYYGTLASPRFSDRWIERAETILSGGNLYRDALTMTPPLVNALLVPPVLVSGWFDHQNPAATLAFMLYFALFNLGTAFILLYQAEDRDVGRAAALAFLLNPLTLGNAIIRRQDEAILVFGFALVLFWLTRRADTRASLAIGATMLIKLTAVLLIPIGLIYRRRWRYAILPSLIFALVMAPFLLTAGEQAVFWNMTQREAQHPFQFAGLNLLALWYERQEDLPPLPVLLAWSALFVGGVGATLVWIMRRPHGLWEDLSLLLGVTLLLTPKLHCGYFALLVLTLAPIMGRYRIAGLTWLFGLLVLLADLVKWPVENFLFALAVMAVALVLLVVILVRITSRPAPDYVQPEVPPGPAQDARVMRHATPAISRQALVGAVLLLLTAALLTPAFVTPQTQRYDIGVHEDYITAMTLLDRESRDGQTFRWTQPGSYLTLHGAYGGQSLLSVRLFHDGRDQASGRELRLVRDGQPELTFAAGPGWRIYHIVLAPGALRSSGVAAAPLALVGGAYAPVPGDERERGVAVDWIEVAPLEGAPSPVGHGLLQALLLCCGLAVAWAAFRYLVAAACDGRVAIWATWLLGAGGVLAAGALVLWSYRDLPSLVWSFPLAPVPVVVSALLVFALSRLTLPRARGSSSARSYP